MTDETRLKKLECLEDATKRKLAAVAIKKADAKVGITGGIEKVNA